MVRPGGRPSALAPIAQHQVILFVIHQIQRGTWSRHQILNAVDYFLRWLAKHPDWSRAVESFDWSHFTPALAQAYYGDIAGDPKGDDWWIGLRSLYRWGRDEGLNGFESVVWRELAHIGRGTALSYDVRNEPTDVRSRFRADPDLPPIPKEFRTRDQRYTVQTASALWVQRDERGNDHGEKVNLLLLEDTRHGERGRVFSQRMLHLVRLFLVEKGSREWAWGTVSAFVDVMRGMQEWLRAHRKMGPDSFGVEQFTHTTFVAYKNYMEGADGPGFSGPLSHVRVFYDWGVESGLPGFDRMVLERTAEVPVTNNPRGELAKALDPKQGAFTMAEQKVIKDALDDESWGTPEQRALVKLCFYFGPRPIQIGRLQKRHLKKHVTSYGLTYVLHVPRAKKRVATDVAVPRGIPPEFGLGALLESLHDPDAPEDASLFPSLAGVTNREGKINQMLKDWAYRGGSRPLRTRRVLTANGSPDLMPINPYRFRRNMATNLARQGASAEAIAQQLDDDDIRMAMVYTENIEELVDALGDVLDTGEYFDILGGWFGRFATEDDASLPVVAAKSVDGPGLEGLLDLGGMGKCGAGALCNLAWPFSCYPCNKFRPDEDGPHEQMLDAVEGKIRESAAHSNRMVMVWRSVRDKIAIVVEAQRRKRAGAPVPSATEGPA